MIPRSNPGTSIGSHATVLPFHDSLNERRRLSILSTLLRESRPPYTPRLASAVAEPHSTLFPVSNVTGTASVR